MKRQNSLEIQAVLSILCLNWKFLGWLYREYIKIAKNDDFWEDLLSENDFEAVLTTFCCYDNSPSAFEEVQKITADQKDCRKCSSCVIVCWIAKIYHSIIVNKGWLLTYYDTSGVAKKAQKKGVITEPWWVLSTFKER